MRILLVEDDPEIGIMLKDYLETENFEVVMAHDGGEVLERTIISPSLFPLPKYWQE